MTKKSGSLEYWRSFFRTSNYNIFDIIDHAIMVAAFDCPKEFRMRRDRIAERLFSCRLTRCSGCDQVELAVPAGEEEEDDDDDGGCKSSESDRDGCEFEAGGSKESKANSSRDDQGEMNTNQISNISFGEAEALTDEIEEATQIFEEVLRIKELLFNCEEESDSVLFESLRRLQLMALTVDTLKTTEIGKAVNRLRKHATKDIRHLARTLIDGWKDMVDEWVRVTAAIAGAEGTPDSVNPSPDSVNPSVIDEDEGLPSPPLDEGAFFATQPTSMELSQFFDGMDDDGNPRNSGEFIKNRDNGRKPTRDCQNNVKQKPHTSNVVNVPAQENKSHQMKKQEVPFKPNKPSNTGYRPARPLKPSAEQLVNGETKSLKKSDKVSVQKKQVTGQQEKFKGSDEVAVQVKLEATKRKLQERYQEAEKAKRQRTIQVMELHDLPKQGLGHRHPHVKPGNHNRHWAHGRR